MRNDHTGKHSQKSEFEIMFSVIMVMYHDMHSELLEREIRKLQKQETVVFLINEQTKQQRDVD